MQEMLNNFFDKRQQYGIIFLRVVAGWRLLAGAWPYALRSKPITQVEVFFQSLYIPLPLISAYVSVYAQFICGFLFIIGLWMRPAAIIMIFNFSVAIIMAHRGDPIAKSFSAWILLAVALCLLFTGAGKISLDERLCKKKQIKGKVRYFSKTVSKKLSF